MISFLLFCFSRLFPFVSVRI